MEKIINVISQHLEQYSWIFVYIRKNKGTLNFPKQFIDFFALPTTPPWAQFYQDQGKFDALPMLALFGAEALKETAEEFRKLSSEDLKSAQSELETHVLSLIDEIDASIDDFEFRFPTKSEIRQYLATTSLEQQKDDLATDYFFLTSYIVQVFQFMSLATHGLTMTDLIKKAISGDDIALCQAVQIDRTTLFAIPYFQQRLIRMQLGNEKVLLASLSRSIKSEILGSKFPNPELWVVFSILNRTGYLTTLNANELLDVCIHLKVYKGDDKDAVTKLKNRFLRRQGHTF